ncbi:YybS family protein [Bacillus alveayuensis]|uniref:YybS family protein n=1 Tax=Aeribacillus alveayuensis TaxID=279215 RepID=UPI0005CDBEED|nr:YybS family protein [Bacillus alveayuensis]
MKNTYVLTEGAIQLAIFTVLFFVSLNIPLLGAVATLFLSLPFIIFTIRHGTGNGLLLLFVSLMIALVVSSVFSVPVAFMFGISGIVIGFLLSKMENHYMILLAGTGAFLVGLILNYIISVVFLQVDVIKETISLLKDAFHQASQFMEAMGNEPSKQLVERFYEGIELISYITPTFFVIGALVLSYLTIFVSIPILKRLRIKTSTWPPFRHIVFPKSLLWYYLIVVIATLFPIEKGTFIYIAVLNIYYLLQILMIIQGFSFIHYISYQKGLARGIVTVFTIISFMIPFFLYLIAILGIIDLGFELRKHINK